MPDNPEPEPTRDGNPNYKVGSIYAGYSTWTDAGASKAVKAASVKGFSTDTTSYSWIVKNNYYEISLYVAPYAPDTSKVSVNGTALTRTANSNSFKYTVPLQIGENVFNIKCTAQNGTSRTYKLTVTREGVIVYGDINGDGKFNSVDLAYMTSHLLNKNLLTGTSLEAADISGDGKVNSLDLAYLTSYLLGRIKKLPR